MTTKHHEYGNALKWGPERVWEKVSGNGFRGFLEKLHIIRPRTEERWIAGVPKPIGPDRHRWLKTLVEDANSTLRGGVRYEVRELVPSDYGMSGGFAWYSSYLMDREENWLNDWTHNAFGTYKDGYYLLGQFTVPYGVIS